MTEKQREQLKVVEANAQNTIGYIKHTANLRTFPNTKHSKNKYVRDCYVAPSVLKTRAEYFILDLMSEINKNTDLYATDYTVLSYNGWCFSCGFVVEDFNSGEIVAYYYFTKSKSICYEF